MDLAADTTTTRREFLPKQARTRAGKARLLTLNDLDARTAAAREAHRLVNGRLPIMVVRMRYRSASASWPCVLPLSVPLPLISKRDGSPASVSSSSGVPDRGEDADARAGDTRPRGKANQFERSVDQRSASRGRHRRRIERRTSGHGCGAGRYSQTRDDQRLPATWPALLMSFMSSRGLKSVVSRW